jgi:hypothetical protein
MTTTYAEIMQAARNLHDHSRHTRFGQAQDIFDYAAPLHPGNHVFHEDADPGAEVMEELVPDAQGLASGLFLGCMVRIRSGSSP